MSKITQYELLPDPADDDLLAVVDVSDQSMNYSGTDKKATVGSLPFLAPTGSGAALTGITAAQVGADASGAADAAREAAEAASMPLPSGTPAAGDVPVATGAGSASAWGSAGGNVASVFGRAGAVTAQSGDYTAAQVGADVSGAAAAVAAVAPSDWHNVVTGYGADPTGAADSTTDIQAAINAVNTAGGGTVYLPKGAYKISSALTLYKNVTLTGAGSGLYTGPTAEPVTVISQTSTTAHGITGVDLGGVTIRALALAGPGSGSVDGVNFTWSAYGNTPFVTLDDVMVYGFGRDGVSVQTPLALSMRRVMSRGNGRDNYSLYGIATTVTASSCWSDAAGRYGWNLTNVNYSQFAGCAAQADATAGWYLNGCESVELAACGAEAQASDSMVITGCNAVRVSGFWIYQNNHYGIHVTSTSYRVTLSDVFETTPAGGAVWSILTDAGSVVTLTDCGAVATAVSLNSGAYQVVTDAGAVTAGGALGGLTAAVTGLPGATNAGRWAGNSFGGAPTSGTFAVGDWLPDKVNECVWFCTAAGTPGTWVRSLQLDATAGDIQPSPGTGAAGSKGQAADAGHVHPQPPFLAPTDGGTAHRYMGAIATGAAPSSGTWLTGDWVVDVSGPTIWVCTAGGTPGTWHAAGGAQNAGFTTIVGALQAFGGIALQLAGNGYSVKEGSNCKQGVATLSAGTIAVANTSVTSTSRIQLTAQDNNSTGALRVSARSAGVSFTITSSNAGDSGVVAYEIFEPS